MKIGLDAQRIFRKHKHGMEVVAIETIKKLQELDHENEYVIYVREDQANTAIKETENFKIDCFPSISSPHWEHIGLVKHASRDHLDVLHSMSNTGPLRYQGALMLTLHDIIYLEGIKLSGNPYQDVGNIYRKWNVPSIVKKCERIVTVSHFEKYKIMNHFNLPEEQIDVIYNGVNPIFNADQRFEGTVNSQIQDQIPENFILFLGNTAPKKNTKGMLEAYYIYHQQAAEPLPLMITDLSLDYVHKNMTAKKYKSIQKDLCILHYVPYAQMPQLYSKAQVFMYPSLRESFGMPILEAMASGTPVITSDTTSMPEVAGGNALLADPYSPEDIAHKLSTLLSDGSLMDRLKQKSIQWSKNFTWDKAAKNLIDLYTTR